MTAVINVRPEDLGELESITAETRQLHALLGLANANECNGSICIASDTDPEATPIVVTMAKAEILTMLEARLSAVEQRAENRGFKLKRPDFKTSRVRAPAVIVEPNEAPEAEPVVKDAPESKS